MWNFSTPIEFIQSFFSTLCVLSRFRQGHVYQGSGFSRRIIRYVVFPTASETWSGRTLKLFVPSPSLVCAVALASSLSVYSFPFRFPEAYRSFSGGGKSFSRTLSYGFRWEGSVTVCTCTFWQPPCRKKIPVPHTIIFLESKETTIEWTTGF